MSYMFIKIVCMVLKKLKTTGRPLEQIYNRIIEESYIENSTKPTFIPFKKVLIKDFMITEKHPNNIIKLISGQIMNKILYNNVHIFGEIYDTINVFELPLHSKSLGIEEMCVQMYSLDNIRF